MAKPRGDLELIEVFSPDDAASWNDEPPKAEPVEVPKTQRKPRRRIVLTALLAATATIAAATIFSDDESSDSAATTTAATSTTVRAPLDPTSRTHFLLHDPTLTAYSADIVTPPSRGRQVHVWTHGSATGPIVIIELNPSSGERYGIVGATREEVDGYELAELKIQCPGATSPVSKQCEMLITEVVVDDEWSVTVRATRSSRGVVTRIASSVRVINGVLAANSDLMELLGFGLTFAAESFDDLIFGRVESSVRYLTADGEIATLRSAVGNPNSWAAGIRNLVTDAQPAFYGRTYGYMMETGEAFVAWEEDGRLLTLVGPGDAGELATVSRQVRAATDAEWTSMLYGLRPDLRIGDFATLASGQTSTNEEWRAGVQIAERADRLEYLWWWTVPGFDDVTASAAASRAVGIGPYFDTLVVPGATFVFVSRPNKGGTVTVRTSTGAVLNAELTQPFSESSVFIAVIRVEEPGPLTVDIDGASVVP